MYGFVKTGIVKIGDKVVTKVYLGTYAWFFFKHSHRIFNDNIKNHHSNYKFMAKSIWTK